MDRGHEKFWWPVGRPGDEGNIARGSISDPRWRPRCQTRQAVPEPPCPSQPAGWRPEPGAAHLSHNTDTNNPACVVAVHLRRIRHEKSGDSRPQTDHRNRKTGPVWPWTMAGIALPRWNFSGRPDHDAPGDSGRCGHRPGSCRNKAAGCRACVRSRCPGTKKAAAILQPP